MNVNRPDPDAADLAAQYAAGAMTAEERSAFEALLASGHEQLLAEVRKLDEAVVALGSASPVQPSAHVKESLLRQIDVQQREAARQSPRQQVWRRWSSDDVQALFTLRAGEGAWENTGVDGVQVRRLFVDKPNNRMTAMFRMAPGTSYPQHVHDGPEECYVLDGDLHVGDDLVMRAGDYQRATPGSHHDVQWTEGGCLLLVTSSLSDEIE
jgi:anti-sigma factor ChrR (cupin superfamily)